MRKYHLVIGDNELVLDYSSDNPNGPQILFDIQQFTASETVNAEIILMNISHYYFTMNVPLLGKKISLSAGMEDSPILRKIGYSGKYGLIAQGFISRVIPDWNGVDTAISVTFQPFPIKTDGNNILYPGYELSVPICDDIRPYYKKIYKQISSNSNNLNMGPDKIKCITAYTQQIYTVAGMSSLLSAQHNLTLGQTGNGFILSNVIGLPINLVPGDFLVQPSLVEYQKIAITLQLRSDIKMNDIVVLPKEIFVGITNLDKGLFTTGIDFQGKSIFNLFHGNYRVIGVWQRGDVNNPEAQAWSTTIQGVLA